MVLSPFRVGSRMPGPVTVLDEDQGIESRKDSGLEMAPRRSASSPPIPVSFFAQDRNLPRIGDGGAIRLAPLPAAPGRFCHAFVLHDRGMPVKARLPVPLYLR